MTRLWFALCLTLYANICSAQNGVRLCVESNQSLCRAPFQDLSAPGDGSTLYYVLRSAPFGDAPTPIYKIDATGTATMVLGLPHPVFPPKPPLSYSIGYYLSPYYLLSHPQFSRDQSVFSYTGQRICLGGIGCN